MGKVSPSVSHSLLKWMVNSPPHICPWTSVLLGDVSDSLGQSVWCLSAWSPSCPHRLATCLTERSLVLLLLFPPLGRQDGGGCAGLPTGRSSQWWQAQNYFINILNDIDFPVSLTVAFILNWCFKNKPTIYKYSFFFLLNHSGTC